MRIDLHRHLGGSISPATALALIRRTNPQTQITLEELQASMTLRDDIHRSFDNFLSKFKFQTMIKWDIQAIELATQQVVWDIARENISHSELKFSIDKYINIPYKEIINTIHSTVQKESHKWDINVDLVLCVKYESDRKQQLEIASLINDPEIAAKIAGIDLVGDERYFDCDFYVGLLKDWHTAGKGIIAHAGETQDPEHVRMAIERLNVNRIAHGITAAQNDDILKLSIERDICFDVAITSNVLTGTVKSYSEHPVKRMLEKGCHITIGTDDPVTLNTSLTREYEILQSICDIPSTKLVEIVVNSLKYAFSFKKLYSQFGRKVS